MKKILSPIRLLLTILAGHSFVPAFALLTNPNLTRPFVIAALPEVFKSRLEPVADGNEILLLTPVNLQVISDWVPLRWILSSPKANEKYFLFVKDLTSNNTLVDYLEIPAATATFGVGALQPGHQYEWGIRAQNLFDPSLSTITSASFARISPNGNSIGLGALSNTHLCPGETLTLPYTVSGFTNTALSTYVMSGDGGFLTDPTVSQTTQSLSLQAPQTSGNLRIRSCAVQDNVLGCSAPSQSFTVGATGAVAVLNAAGHSTSLACTGNSVQLSAHLAEMTSGLPRSYYWLKNGCERIANATDSTLTVREAGYYQAVVTSADGCPSISPKHAVTYEAAVTPTLETNQLNGFRCDWADAYVKTNLVGTENTYTWRRNGTVLSAPSQPLLSITQPGTYEVTVSGPHCAVTSESIEVKASSGLALAIRTTQPAICANQPRDTYLYAEIDEIDRNKVAYQWLKNGVPVAGARTDFVYTRTPGSYTLKVMTGTCAMVSNAVVVGFGNPVKPIVLNGATPVSGTVRGCAEEAIVLKTDPPPGTLVRWKQGEILDNAFGVSRTITSSGTYRAIVFSSSDPGACYTESDPVEVLLGGSTDVLLEGDNVMCGWNSTMLRYTGNTSSRDFQWYRDGNIMEGNTYPNFLINDPGTYTLQVRTHYPSGCTGMSSPITVSGTNNAFPRTITAAGGTQRCAGLGVPLSFSPGLAGTIQWKKNGEPIAGANKAYFHAFASGAYTVEVTQNTCRFLSSPIEVQIKEPVTAQLSGSATIPYPNAPTSLQVQLTGEGPFHIAFTDGTVVDNIQTSTYERVVAPGATTTYELASVSNACGTGLRSGVAIVSVVNGAIYSIQSGNWQDPATWSCHCVPTAANDVEIRQGHTVAVGGVEAHARNIILSGGSLNYTEAGFVKLSH